MRSLGIAGGGVGTIRQRRAVSFIPRKQEWGGGEFSCHLNAFQKTEEVFCLSAPPPSPGKWPPLGPSGIHKQKARSGSRIQGCCQEPLEGTGESLLGRLWGKVWGGDGGWLVSEHRVCWLRGASPETELWGCRPPDRRQGAGTRARQGEAAVFRRPKLPPAQAACKEGPWTSPQAQPGFSSSPNAPNAGSGQSGGGAGKGPIPGLPLKEPNRSPELMGEEDSATGGGALGGLKRRLALRAKPVTWRGGAGSGAPRFRQEPPQTARRQVGPPEATRAGGRASSAGRRRAQPRGRSGVGGGGEALPTLPA